MVNVYKPAVGYNKQSYTQIEKPSFLNGLMQYGTFVGKEDASTSGSPSEIYSVPRGKVFFMTGAHMMMDTDTGTSQMLGALYISQNDNSRTIFSLSLHEPGGTGKRLNYFLSFPIPIIVRYSEPIYVSCSNASGIAVGGVFGYLVDESVVPNFL